MKEILTGVGVAIIGFLLTECIMFFIKRSKFRRSLAQDIRNTIGAFQEFHATIGRITASPVSLSDLPLKFFWNDGQGDTFDLIDATQYLEPDEFGSVSAYFGAFGRFGEVTDKYNDLLTELLKTGTNADPLLLAGMKACNNDVVAQCEAVIQDGKEALCFLERPQC